MNIFVNLKLEIIDEASLFNLSDRDKGKLIQMSSFALNKYIQSVDRDFSLALHFLDDEQMCELNFKYRSKDSTTDVLSFPIYDSLRHSSKEIQNTPLVELGDIFISIPVLKKQAKEFKISDLSELFHLYVHGFLHILGFDHEISDFEEKVMQDCEKTMLRVITGS